MAKKQKQTTVKRGEVYLVNFSPTIGAEVKKSRPALIVQNDVGNRYSPITIVVAITSQFEDSLYPTEVFIQAQEGGLQVDSVALCNQVRSIDKQRLIKRLGILNQDTMRRINIALEVSLELVEI